LPSESWLRIDFVPQTGKNSLKNYFSEKKKNSGNFGAFFLSKNVPVIGKAEKKELTKFAVPIATSSWLGSTL
jgi:hypothetical protein